MSPLEWLLAPLPDLRDVESWEAHLEARAEHLRNADLSQVTPAQSQLLMVRQSELMAILLDLQKDVHTKLNSVRQRRIAQQSAAPPSTYRRIC